MCVFCMLSDHDPLGIDVDIREDFSGALEQRVKTWADHDAPELRPAAHLDHMTSPERWVEPDMAARHQSEHTAPQ